MDWLKDVISVVGAGGLGAALLYIVHLRSNIRIKRADADIKEAHANKAEAETLQTQADYVVDLIKDFNQYKQETNTRMVRLERAIAFVINQWSSESNYHCNDLGCVKRNPALGKHRIEVPEWIIEILEQK